MHTHDFQKLRPGVRELGRTVDEGFHSQDFLIETRDLYCFKINAEWRFECLDGKIANLVEYSHEDFENEMVNWLDIIHPEDKELVLGERRRGLESDRYYSADYRIITKRGTTKWIRMRGPILCDGEGSFVSIRGVMNDITPQKDMELALASEYEIFVRFANNMNDGVYIISEDFRIRFMNKALINLFGNHVGELCYEALFQRDSACPWSVMDLIKREGYGFQEYDLPLQEKTYHVASFPIRLEDGSIGKLGLFTDLTEIRRLQDELNEYVVKHQAIQAAADMANIGIVILQDYAGIEARHRYVNEAFCRATGYETEELLRLSIADIAHPDDKQICLDRYRGRLRGEKLDAAYELKIVRKDGVTITTLLSGALSTYDRELAAVVFFRDITDRKRMEYSMWLSQRLASIGRLAAEIAHEINNPLTSVLTFNRLLERIVHQEPFPMDRLGELRQYVDYLSAEAGRCAEIARNLLDFSRQGEIKFEQNDINQILEKTVNVMRHRAEMSGIEISASYAEDIPDICCDYKRLQQAFVNLIMNAFEAMPNGGVLSLSTEFTPAQSLVTVTISDTGGGIPAEDLEKIFEPFFTSKAEGKGVGLGLSVAYGIIKQHQGEIHVQSEVGRGTTFVVHLRGDICVLPAD